jgi:general secretion pathway protein K
MSERDERGIVLPIVLLAVSLLIVVILGFDTEARRELKAAAGFRDAVSASALNWAGLQTARAVLLEDTIRDLKAGQTFDGLTDSWKLLPSPLSLGEGLVNVSISDERSKLNINDLALPKDSKQREATVLRFKRLFTALNLDPRLVETLTDWVDEDDVPERNGAETRYYESLTPPYRTANEAVQTLDELRLVRGMTDDSFQRLQQYITVYPFLSDGWININTADPIVIQSLNAKITPAMAMDIVQARPFRSLKDLDKVMSVEAVAKELRLVNAYDVWSDYFIVRISAEIGETTKNSRAVVQRSRADGSSTIVAFEIE